MSSFARPRLSVLLPLGLLGCGEAGEKVALRFHPPAGATYGYELEQDVTMAFEGGPMAGMGEQQMTMRMFFTQAVEGPQEWGGIAVSVTYDSTRIESSLLPAGMMDAALGQLRGLKGRFIYDDQMRVLRGSVTTPRGMDPQMADQLRNATKGFVLPLPKDPVGRGDSWTERVELPMGQIPGASGPIHATTALTVREVRIAGPDTSVLLDVETTMPEEPITFDVQGQRATIHLTGSLAGQQLYSLNKGAVLEADMSGTMRMNMSGGPMTGMTMSMQQQIKMRLTGER